MILRRAALMIGFFRVCSAFALAAAPLIVKYRTGSHVACSKKTITTKMSSLLLIEHINLNVGDAAVALNFYCDGLGCCPDPFRLAKIQSLHVNVGPLCQFHTASPTHEAYISAEGPQIWRGQITIAYRERELHAAVERLQELVRREPLAGTHCKVGAIQDKQCQVTCPYGNKYLLRAASESEEAALAPSSGIGRPGSEASKALGIAGISLPCAEGASAAIGRFYERCLGFHATTGQGRVEILGGPGACQKLEFYEVADAPPPRYTGDHFCFYVADLQACFERCSAAGVVWVNPRFTHLDESRTWEDCVRFKQFRFKHVVDPEGRVLYEQEHEVRMAEHGSYPLDKLQQRNAV